MDPQPKDSDGVTICAKTQWLRTCALIPIFRAPSCATDRAGHPHSARGRAVSLVERQVVALRDQLTIERKHLRNLVEAARQNTRLQQRLQRIF